jgi:HAD superfamily hydrolase (TIGR01509 family)
MKGALVPSRSTLQAVLFDMDGTLVDTEGLWWQTAEEEAARLGLTLGDEDVPDVLGQAVEHTAKYLHSRSGGVRSADSIAAALDARFVELVAHQVVPLPGALELLDGLAEAGVATALVSASPRHVVDLVLDALGRRRFATSFAAGETPLTKPAPDPYLAAVAALGASPDLCVAVEDTPTGVASAEAAGVAVVAVPSLTPIPPRPGRAVVRSLLDVDLTLLQRLLDAATV